MEEQGLGWGKPSVGQGWGENLADPVLCQGQLYHFIRNSAQDAQRTWCSNAKHG